ncbi:MAG: GGDEF domain-containing phosphodiesterase, partial [Bacilli bacterium]
MIEQEKELSLPDYLKSAIKDIVSVDYEFAILIDISTHRCNIINKHGVNEIPYLLKEDKSPYEDELNAFLNNSISSQLKDEEEKKMSFETILKNTEGNRQYSVIFPVRYPDSSIKYKKWKYYRLSCDPDFMVFTRVDVTDSVLAECDTVTGIQTKERALVEIRKLLLSRRHERYYMMWIDFDDFKDYNQLFGRDKGNELLHFLTQKLSDIKIKDIQVAHIESDNFLFFLPIEEFREKDFRNLYREVSDYNPDFSFSISIGITTVDKNTNDLLMAIEEAHAANIKLKTVRGISFKHYDERNDKTVFTNQSIIPYIRQGIRDKEFVIYYQPIINSKTNKVETAEALVRWSSKRFGFIRPDHFIPILEKSGFIVDLDYYVREEVLCYFENRIKNKEDVFPISVNISRIELNDFSFPSRLKKQIDAHHVPASLLRIEFTESIVMEAPDIAKVIMKELKELGFYLEMDDFGSGYSSLAVLREFPFDLLKLDMKFFKDNVDNTKTEAIIDAISSLAFRL